jgi:hypothetical protein
VTKIEAQMKKIEAQIKRFDISILQSKKRFGIINLQAENLHFFEIETPKKRRENAYEIQKRNRDLIASVRPFDYITHRLPTDARRWEQDK